MKTEQTRNKIENETKGKELRKKWKKDFYVNIPTLFYIKLRLIQCLHDDIFSHIFFFFLCLFLHFFFILIV